MVCKVNAIESVLAVLHVANESHNVCVYQGWVVGR